HPVNSSWKNAHCEECTCGETEMSCCSIASKPSMYDKKKCQVIFHKKNCTYTVVEHNNPGKACVVQKWIL
ncbi:beta-microseminoprotein, partial [Heterocephalus glaber]|uniref:Beta-microseminoprotein n=1 Tax=Heterocephalus glaber TaxID=10181 RepID=A0AAX6QT71_HETGA